MNLNEYCSLIKENPSLRNKDDMIESNILKTALSLVSDSKLVQEITDSLMNDGIVQLKKGEASYSNVQRKIVEYWNNQFHNDLYKQRKTSFSLTEEEIKDYFSQEEEGVCVLNNDGHLIRHKCNQTNITEKRLTDATKKTMEETTKNLEKKSK